jgi:hypothetical protein
MYLTYDKYVSMGGKLDNIAFAKAEAEAESLLDVWTLNRLKSPSVLSDLEAQGLGGAVSNATMAIIDRLDGIREARNAIASGQVVTSFNNGVNSFSFANGGTTNNQAEVEAYVRVCELLPIDVVSACVCFNNAR